MVNHQVVLDKVYDIRQGERLGGKSLRDLVVVIELEEKQTRGQRQQTHSLSNIQLTDISTPEDHRNCLNQMASLKKELGARGVNNGECPV